MKTSKNSSLTDPVYEKLRDKILNLEIKSGEKIPESRLAQEYRISRTPIREAIRRLANEGLVNIYPNRYAEVIVFDDEFIKNMGIARLSMDITAIKLAIYYGGNADFERLKELADECYDASLKNDRFRQNHLDVSFHREISRIAGNPFIQKYQSQIFLQLELLLNARYSNTDVAYITAHDLHQNIVDSMFSRDMERAVSLIAKHHQDFYQFDKSLSFLLP